MSLKRMVTETDIKFWIQIGTVLIAITGGIIMMREQVKSNSSRIDMNYKITQGLKVELTEHKLHCEANHKANDQKLLDIQVTLAEIQKDIQYIKLQINGQ